MASVFIDAKERKKRHSSSEPCNARRTRDCSFKITGLMVSSKRTLDGVTILNIF